MTRISLLESVVVAVISMLVVFAVLMLIAFLIYTLNIISSNLQEKQKPTETVREILSISDEETIAIISATLAAYLGAELSDFKIRNIRGLD
ncbi:OadG family protein [Microaceticoccus formicicus]|uniref:OadG family protein n=1 Tax=Microaceticoccus formicicus TaxID=3118105 RepID=UPI003CD036EC|nr:OadG family protein [Peptoniphilaceae bacterium AMB_02]